MQEWHLRWFRDHLPRTGVGIRNLSEEWLGFSLSGPRSREILAALADEDVANAALPFMSCRTMNVGMLQAVVGRLSLTGELGYEITVPASQQRALWAALCAAGKPFGLRQIGMRALDSLRFEKGNGVWSAEFAQSYTPGMSGLDRLIDFTKPDFIGRSAALRERETGAAQRLVLMAIDSIDADAFGFEPIWVDGKSGVGIFERSSRILATAAWLSAH